MTNVNTLAEPSDITWPDPAKITVEIAFFDENDRTEIRRDIPLSRFLDELYKPPAPRF